MMVQIGEPAHECGCSKGAVPLLLKIAAGLSGFAALLFIYDRLGRR